MRYASIPPDCQEDIWNHLIKPEIGLTMVRSVRNSLFQLCLLPERFPDLPETQQHRFYWTNLSVAYWTLRQAPGILLIQCSCLWRTSQPPSISFCISFPKTQIRKGICHFMCQTDGWEEWYLGCWIVWMKHLGMDLKHYIVSTEYWQNHWS